MKYLKIYLKDHKAASILAPLFKMLEATFDLLVPIVVANIINIGIAGKDMGYILRSCGLLILMALVGLACSFTAQYFAAKAAIASTTACGTCFSSISRPWGFLRWIPSVPARSSRA